MATNPPITIGELSDVPQPGSGVKSAWCQEITHRIHHRFGTTAARTTGFPAPAKGQASYLTTNDINEGPEYYDGTAWRKPWNMPWGRLATGAATDVSVGASATALGATTSVMTLPNRSYRMVIEQASSYGSVAGDSWTVAFGEVGQATISGVSYATFLSNAYFPAGGANVMFTVATAANRAFDIRVTRAGGSGTLQARFRLTLFDDGPGVGAPT